VRVPVRALSQAAEALATAVIIGGGALLVAVSSLL
jgi:hypothetical protein